MDCATFKQVYEKYTNMPLPQEICETEEYEQFTNHTHGCKSCNEWDLTQRVAANGFSVSDFPCVHIAYYVTANLSDEKDEWENPDVTLVKMTGVGFGIPIRDGGSSMMHIQYCPWCGIKIKEECEK